MSQRRVKTTNFYEEEDDNTTTTEVQSISKTQAVEARSDIPTIREIPLPAYDDEASNSSGIETLHLSDGSAFYYTDIRHLGCHGNSTTQSPPRDVITRSEADHSDLIPGVYEGGLKIWECSIDLAEYLVDLKIDFTGLKVLELGCGAALPAIYTATKGAEIHLQDYNEEVLHQVTIPNMLLNTEKSCLKCKLYAGDWFQLGDMEKNGKNIYDTILTSETIYNVESYETLHNAMETLLKADGQIFVAAKTHYFGVGGGVELFKDFVTRKNIFTISTAKQYDEGVERQILKMRFRSSPDAGET